MPSSAAPVRQMSSLMCSPSSTLSTNSSALFRARQTKHRLHQSRKRARDRVYPRNSSTAHARDVAMHRMYTASAIGTVLSEPEGVGEAAQRVGGLGEDQADDRDASVGVGPGQVGNG